jgi:hypothetical protein
MSGAAFYLVADSRYFLGAVGTINSLRLLGHDEPIHVLDCGLSAAELERLDGEATIVPGPDDVPPCLLKTVAPLRHPADVMVLIDADIIVTRRLSELIGRATAGRVLAFKDDEDRFFGEQWGEVLGTAVPDRLPYVSSSLVVLGGPEGRRVAQGMDDLQPKLDLDGSPFSSRVPDSEFFRGDFAAAAAAHPFTFPEQDLLNAILAARLEPGAVEVLERRLEATPPFKGIRLVDEGRLRCAYADGTEPYALHHYAIKPWLEPARHGVYSKLLSRLLRGDDVAISVDDVELPRRLRSGPLAWLDRTRVDLGETLHWHVREPLASRLRGRSGGG